MNLLKPGILCFIIASGTAQAADPWLDKVLPILQDSTQGGSRTTPSSNSKVSFSNQELSSAFQQALQIGTSLVVQKLGVTDGFNADPKIHIPLPKDLKRTQSWLKKIGMSAPVDDLETRLNRAAEAATPEAKKLFGQAISSMTFDDVMSIYNGAEDSATRYFQNKMSPALSEKIRPIIDNTLVQVGAIQALNQVASKYQALQVTNSLTAKLTDYVTQKTLDGIFYYVAQEEAAIRRDPIKQTTSLLKKVFGSIK